MKEFKYVIQDGVGIHARPAGQLVVLAKEFKSEIKIHKGDVVAPLTNLMKLLSMGIKQNDEVTVRAAGEDEDIVIKKLEDFFKNNL